MARESNVPQKREQIVWALYNCLAKGGHERITVKDIAAQAGLAHGVIHYYFKTKDEIVAALVVAITRKYQDTMAQVLAEAGNKTDHADAVLDLLVDAFIFNKDLNRVFYNLVQMGFERAEVSRPLAAMLRAYRDTLEGVLLRDEDAQDGPSQAAVLVALIEGMALQWMIDPQSLGRDQARRLVKKALQGIRRRHDG